MKLALAVFFASILTGCGCTFTAGVTLEPAGGYFSVKLPETPTTQPTTQSSKGG
jgi:hypothetical protein